jgi:hypothetical protein
MFWLRDGQGADYFEDLSMDGRLLFKFIANNVGECGLNSSG